MKTVEDISFRSKDAEHLVKMMQHVSSSALSSISMLTFVVIFVLLVMPACGLRFSLCFRLNQA